MRRAYYDKRPSALEAVGNGDYLYRWDIQEEKVQREMMQDGSDETASSDKVQYSCREVTIHGTPEYGKCIEAVIRSDYSAEAELSLINQYNAYQQGVTDDASVVGEYEEYLSFVSSVKDMVKKDMEIEPSVRKSAATPRITDVARLLTMTVNTMSLTDNEALSVKSIYPEWETLIGKEAKQGDKMQCDGKLWKVLQEHTVQEQWKPGTGTESLYTEIVESAAGTVDDPIPYDNNMELEQGKYYSQDGEVYLCTRGTGIPVYNQLADLVGIYVELID